MSLLTLSVDQIDLWLVFYDEIHDPGLLNNYRQLLTDEERKQELRFHFANDQVRYLVTRALVRTVLSRYAAVKPEQWRFEPSAYGRPEITNDRELASLISFNISHTNSLIVLGVTSGRALGVDTENVHVRKVTMDLADHYFSPQEVAALRALPTSMQHDRFFDYWTLKESYIKAKGKGLSIPLDQFSFDLPAPQGIEVSFRPELNDGAMDWHFWQFQTAAHYLVAVCAQRIQSTNQQLVVRKLVPLDLEEPLEYTILRQSV